MSLCYPRGPQTHFSTEYLCPGPPVHLPASLAGAPTQNSTMQIRAYHSQDIPDSACCLSPAPGFTFGNTTCLRTDLTLRPDEVPNESQNLIHGPGQQEKEHSLPREEQRRFVSDLNSCSSCAALHTITPVSLLCPLLSTVVYREIMSPFHFIVTRFFLTHRHSVDRERAT